MYKVIIIGLLYVGSFQNLWAQTSCTLIEDDWNWIAQQKACPSSPTAAYNAVIQLHLQGKKIVASQLLSDSLNEFVSYQPLQQLSKDMQDWPEDPYRLIAYFTDKELKAWITNLRPELFSATLPIREAKSPLPKLVKGEFETTLQFTNRVAKAQKKRHQLSDKLEVDYQQAVRDFNWEVKQYNIKLKEDKAERPSKIAKRQRELLTENIARVFGRPRLQNVDYNADEQLFFGELVSSNGNFKQPVKFSVPLSNARLLKENVASILPIVDFSITNSTLSVNRISLPFRSHQYSATFTSDINTAPVMTAQLEDSSSQSAYASLSPIQPSNPDRYDDTFFNTALNLEEDPELVRQKKERAELQRQIKVARLDKAKEAKIKKGEQEIARLKQEIQESIGGNSGKNRGLKASTKWTFKPPAKPASETVMVIIGNRAYSKGVPPVYYAYNDSRAMKEFALSGLGLQAEDILYEEDATKGVMEGLFKSTLPARIKAGKKNVIVYFSGHGMAADNDAKLLPVDARPNTAAVTGYSRNALMDQLASLGVNSTVILDACYTGTSKDGAALIEGKPIFKAPKGAFVPKNVTLISASSGNQIAWMDEEKGHSLMTYHLLKGLEGLADSNNDRQIDSKEIARYLKTSVNNAALILHEQPQEPEVKGINQLLLSY